MRSKTRAALLPRIVAFVALLLPAAALGGGDRALFLDLARKGWVYELRSAVWGRDPATIDMRINSRNLAGSALCIIGEPPHPQTEAVLGTFRALMADVYGKPIPMRFAGPDISACGTRRNVYLRLYSGQVPLRSYNVDLGRLDAVYGIGLPRDRPQYVLSPAQAATFFGSRGQVTHLIVMQPDGSDPTALESRFFSSILIEELYQAFTFGMDILHFDRSKALNSKLQEFPVNLRHIPWDSPDFMEGLLRTNPTGLCRFDLFMLHALAEAPTESTNTEAFIDFIDGRFDEFLARADAAAARPDFHAIVDGRCAPAD